MASDRLESRSTSAFAIERTPEEQQPLAIEIDRGILDDPGLALVVRYTGAIGTSIDQYASVNFAFDAAVIARDMDASQDEITGRVAPNRDERAVGS